MLTLQDHKCPECGRTASKQLKGFILCPLHGWIEPIKQISMGGTEK